MRVVGPVGRICVVVTIAIAGTLALPTTAVPEGKITIRGADSGSHLRLSVKHNRIVVDGLMTRRGLVGCHRTKWRVRAVCPLRNVGVVEIVMGPSGDMVEILERLPAPVVAYLGGGRDKMVANGEPDYCYPGGARRNRCVGGPGRDICITGNRNSDCVGGPGSDYCKHGAGSDGCWGGSGRDICVMRSGQDGCHGGRGDDRLYGGRSPDRLYGGPGHDFCDGGPGWGKSQNCEAGPRR